MEDENYSSWSSSGFCQHTLFDQIGASNDILFHKRATRERCTLAKTVSNRLSVTLKRGLQIH
jgi:hypothetical protein